MGLGSHLNVYNTCLHILQSRGFELEVSGEPAPDNSYPASCLWIARRGDFHFCGDNPIELIGLVAIYDHLQPSEDIPYWWKINVPDISTELMEKAFPEKS